MGVNGLASGCVMFLSIVRFFSRGGGLKKKQKNHFVIFKCFFFSFVEAFVEIKGSIEDWVGNITIKRMNTDNIKLVRSISCLSFQSFTCGWCLSFLL